MSFRLKILLWMSALVAAIAGTVLVVTQKAVLQEYRLLAESQLDEQFQAILDRQKLRLKTVFERVGDAIDNPRLVAAFQIENSEERSRRLYTDLGAELLPVLENDVFFLLFDGNHVPIHPPEDYLPSDLGSPSFLGLSNLLPAHDPKAGQLVLGPSDRFHEVIVQPIVDDFDDTFLGTLILAIPLGTPADVLGDIGDSPLALQIGTSTLGDIFGADSEELKTIDFNGTQFQILRKMVPQAAGFPPMKLIAGSSLSRRNQALARLRRSVSLVGIGALLGGFLLSYLVAQQISRPVADLTEGTAQILAGKLGTQISVPGTDEMGRLTSAFNEMSEGLALKEQYRSVLDRVSDPRVAKELTSGTLELGGEELPASVLFCDIRGFTALTEDMSPGEIVALLNEHMTLLTEVVHRHQGVVDKFVGDEIMVLFGVPHSQGNDPLSAVECAIEMITERALRNRRSDAPVEIGIGIATGSVLAGCMGSEERLNYTVLGARVNLAARLCAHAKPMSILVDQTTHERLAGTVDSQSIGELELKGFRRPASAFQIKTPS